MQATISWIAAYVRNSADCSFHILKKGFKGSYMTNLDVLESEESILVVFRLSDESWSVAYANIAARELLGLPSSPVRADVKTVITNAGFPVDVMNRVGSICSVDVCNANNKTLYRFCFEADPTISALSILRIFPLKNETSFNGSSKGYLFDSKFVEAQSKGISEVVASAHIHVRTFGYFDVFVDGKPIPFNSEKAKELLALLVDRRGGFVSSSEGISILWEDEPLSEQTRSRYRKVAMRLKAILEAFGIGEILETVGGKRRIVPESLECDLYDFLANGPQAKVLFLGIYLRNYSWGEITLSELLRISGV